MHTDMVQAHRYRRSMALSEVGLRTQFFFSKRPLVWVTTLELKLGKFRQEIGFYLLSNSAQG